MVPLALKVPTSGQQFWRTCNRNW